MSTQKPDERHDGSGDEGIERRRYPRVEIVGRIQGRAAPLDIPITVLDISLGGVAVRTDAILPVGEVHEFRFTPINGEPLVISARVVHSLRAGGATESVRYFSGLEFIADETPSARLALHTLLADLTSP